MIPLLDKTAQLLRGQSYWQIKLTTGRTYSELDHAVAFQPDPITGRPVARTRKIEWLEHIVQSGDTRNIKELHLITPQGDAMFYIHDPYTGFQFKRGVATLFTGQRIANAQIIGRVDNRETGECTATIWDVQEQRLYTDHKTNVRNFTAWRPGITNVGALNLEVVGVRLT